MPWLCIALVIGLLSFPTSSSAKFTQALERLIPVAKTEGEVSIFAGSPRYTAAEAARISKTFEGVYGIPMKVNLASLGDHPGFVRRLREEAKVGVKPVVDIVPTGIKFLNNLKQAGLLEAVQWKELGVPEKDLIPAVEAVESYTNVRGIIYNTKLVKRADAPRKFEDLLDPKWKGKIVAPAFPTAFPYIALVMGEEAGLKLVKRLVEDQKMAFAPTYSDIGARVASGEFLIGYGYTAGRDKVRGAPVENAPAKVGAFRYGAAVLKKAAHPAAARLLIHFITTTPEGTKVAYEILNWGKVSTPGTEAYEIAHEGGLVFPKPADEVRWETEEHERIANRFRQVLGF
jgi:iron(III) transport system substrate-binding protein